MRSRPAGVPVYKPDIYSVDAIVDPYPHYRRLRDIGAVVWLTKQKVYALPRYTECKAVLRDDKAFQSGRGVALNPITNRLSGGTTLNSDGAEHDQRRKHLAHRMLPRALRAISDNVDATAKAVVDAALSKGEIDGVTDLAAALPMAVVPDLIGWPRNQRDRLIAWGGATFDVLGPLNWQAIKAMPAALRMLHFARRIVRERNVIEGSMAHELLAAADEGMLSHRECPPLMVDYLAPSIDTTMSSISNALYLFASHPDQWQLLKDEPNLMANAINEVVRYEPPLRAFARYVSTPTEVGDVTIPSGSRVLVMYASANRDEREWDEPEVFDIRRDAGRHIGFGHGAHACAGQGLARLETTAMLGALLERVDHIELTGSPTWALNNIIRRHERLPLKLIPS
jgi:cytochrome P450